MGIEAEGVCQLHTIKPGPHARQDCGCSSIGSINMDPACMQLSDDHQCCGCECTIPDMLRCCGLCVSNAHSQSRAYVAMPERQKLNTNARSKALPSLVLCYRRRGLASRHNILNVHLIQGPCNVQSAYQMLCCLDTVPRPCRSSTVAVEVVPIVAQR